MTSHVKNCLFGVIAMVVMLFWVTAVYAAEKTVSLKDVQTISRTIGFLENASTNSVIAVIYNPNSSESVKSAHQIEDLIINEKSDLHPRLVPMSDNLQLQGASFAFVTDGMETYYDTLGTKLRNAGILSFTLERACLDNGCCAVYINSKDRVEIVVNKTVVDAIKAHFKPVFLMMVTVI